MRNIKLTIEYDGTKFNGWQIQQKNIRTVQGEIEQAINKVFQKNLRVYGAGRTDSGVHALGQVANFKIPHTKLSVDQIRNALNAYLSEDIIILKVAEVPIQFHSQFNAISKHYCYTIFTRLIASPIKRHYTLHYPFKLNLSLIRKESHDLIGKKDFRSFMAMDTSKRDIIAQKDTKRNLYRLDIKKKGDYIKFDFEANGFLYKMVRNIVGTLLEIGLEKLPPGSIKRIMKEKNRIFAGITAPATGLCLIEVKY